MKKICTKCKAELDANIINFHADKTKSDGFCPVCKNCRCKTNRRSFNAKEGHKICQVCKKELPATEEYFHKNKKGKLGFLGTCKKCRKDNADLDKISKQRKRYYYNNKKEELQRHKDWCIKNPEKVKEFSRIKKQKRKAMKKQLPNNFTLKDWNKCKEYFNNECAYCGCLDNLAQDHVIPITKGGGYIKDNIIPACKSCNSSKCDKDMKDWYKKQSFYSEDKFRKIKKYIRGDENGI